MRYLLILFLSFSFSANLLLVNDNADSNYFGQYEHALTQISMAYDYWDSQTSGDLNYDTLSQYDLVFVFGNGTSQIPLLTYETNNPFSSYLDQGGKLVLIDQNYFSANGLITDYQFSSGDFAFDYFGLGSAIVNPEPPSPDSTSVIGGSFTFQEPLVLHYDIYHMENSIDYISIENGNGIFRQFPGSQWLGLSNNNSENSAMSMYLSFAADAVVKEGLACEDGSEPMIDCIGTEFCNDDPIYSGYDCIVGCENQWLGDGYCDDGAYGFVFQCEEFGWDCGDCGDEVIDPNGYCDDGGLLLGENTNTDKIFGVENSKSNLLMNIFEQRDHATLTHSDELQSLIEFIIELFDLTSPPFIHSISGPTGEINNFTPQNVEVNITDFQSTISNVELLYANQDGEFIDLVMSTDDGLTYTGTLPGFSIPGTEVEYKISATNENGLTSESQTLNYSIFDVTSDVLLVLNDSYEYDVTLAEYINNEYLSHDRWLGGVSSEQIQYYNTIFEIVPYFGSNYTNHINIINNWLNEGGKNYFVAGDDLAYLLGISGINDSTLVESMSDETGNLSMTEYFFNLGVELHVNDIQYEVSGMDFGSDALFGFSSNPFPVLADEGDPISGAIYDENNVLGLNLFVSPTTAFGLYNYIDGLVPVYGATGIFNTYFTGSDDGTTGYNSQICTGVRSEGNGNKVVYLAFNPFALYSNVEDSLNMVHWGYSPESPINQAIEWFELETMENINISTVPNKTNLHFAYPNPFNPVTNISFYLEENSKIDLSIFNINGEKVFSLLNGFHHTGEFNINWDASEYPSGIYFVKLNTGNFNQTQKLILLK